MIGLLQRVSEAAISIEGETISEIKTGLLVLVGVEKTDTETQARRLFDKLIAYRVFPDNDGKMNLSLQDINGGLLLVPQFTLAANTRKGLRPSFSNAAAPEHGKPMFDYLIEHARQHFKHTGCGVFGADMQVSLVNDGPVTFWIQI